MKKLRKLGLIAGFMAVLMTAGVVSGVFVRPALAIDLGDILKVGGIVLVVTTFGSQINSTINNALGQKEAASVGATKVVPILSIGSGAYVGAAQVIGVPANVKRVQAVAAVELTVGNISGTGLLPISTKSATSRSSLSTVSGVGVGAIIDFHI